MLAAPNIYPQNPQPSGGDKSANRRLNLLQPLVTCWFYQIGDQSNFGIASDNASEFYMPLLEGKLASIDSDSGAKQWETELGGEIVSPPSADASNIYTASAYTVSERNRDDTGSKTIVRSLDKVSGIPLWETELAVSLKVYLLANRNSLILVGLGGSVFSLDKADGHIIWSRDFSSDLTAVPFLEGKRIVLGFSNRISLISLDGGQTVGELMNVEKPTAVALDKTDRGGNTLFWGDKKGNLAAFNVKLRRANWTSRKGAEISDIIYTAQGLLVISQDNFLYLISEKSGSLIWKKRFGSRISNAPLVSDHYVILTTVAEPIAFVVELKTGKSVNSISLSTDNLFVGGILQSGNFIIFPTLKGIFAFSNQGFCSDKTSFNTKNTNQELK